MDLHTILGPEAKTRDPQDEGVSPVVETPLEEGTEHIQDPSQGKVKTPKIKKTCVLPECPTLPKIQGYCRKHSPFRCRGPGECPRKAVNNQFRCKLHEKTVIDMTRDQIKDISESLRMPPDHVFLRPTPTRTSELASPGKEIASPGKEIAVPGSEIASNGRKGTRTSSRSPVKRKPLSPDLRTGVSKKGSKAKAAKKKKSLKRLSKKSTSVPNHKPGSGSSSAVPKCEVEGCLTDQKIRGFCRKHNQEPCRVYDCYSKAISNHMLCGRHYKIETQRLVVTCPGVSTTATTTIPGTRQDMDDPTSGSTKHSDTNAGLHHSDTNAGLHHSDINSGTNHSDTNAGTNAGLRHSDINSGTNHSDTNAGTNAGLHHSDINSGTNHSDTNAGTNHSDINSGTNDPDTTAGQSPCLDDQNDTHHLKECHVTRCISRSTYASGLCFDHERLYFLFVDEDQKDKRYKRTLEDNVENQQQLYPVIRPTTSSPDPECVVSAEEPLRPSLEQLRKKPKLGQEKLVAVHEDQH